MVLLRENIASVSYRGWDALRASPKHKFSSLKFGTVVALFTTAAPKHLLLSVLSYWFLFLLWLEALTDRPLLSGWASGGPLHCHLLVLVHQEGLVGHQAGLHSQQPLSGDSLVYPHHSVLKTSLKFGTHWWPYLQLTNQKFFY